MGCSPWGRKELLGGVWPRPWLSRALCCSRASEEIAQVRSKAQTDALALQAVLRKEQMRVHSLEKVVDNLCECSLLQEVEPHSPLNMS